MRGLGDHITLPLSSPTPTLPDSILPGPLKRIQPLGRPLFSPNDNDQALLREAAAWKYVAENGGLDAATRMNEVGAKVYDQDPRLGMPQGGIVFQPVFAIDTALVSGGPPYNGVDTVIGTFVVQIGYDGVINRFANSFTGTGFVDFSGNIIWKVKVGQRFARDLGNVVNQIGTYSASFAQPGSYIPLVSGVTVLLIANIPNGSPVLGGKVTAGINGWTYPRR